MIEISRDLLVASVVVVVAVATRGAVNLVPHAGETDSHHREIHVGVKQARIVEANLTV